MLLEKVVNISGNIGMANMHQQYQSPFNKIKPAHNSVEFQAINNT